MIVAVAQLFTRHPGRKAGQGSFGSLDQVGAGIGPGGRFIQLDDNSAPQLRLDDGRVHVPADEGGIVPAVVRGKVFFGVGIAPERRGGERSHPAEMVFSARQVHVLCHGAQSMGGVQVSVDPGMVFRPPGPFPARVPQLRHQAVDICGLPVEQIADDPLPDHVQEHKLVPAVVDVFHHHAVLPGGLAGVHQIPEFFQGDGQRNFHKGVRAVLHAVAGDSGMGTPVRADDDSVRFQLLQHGQVFRVPAGITQRAFPHLGKHAVHAALGQVFLQITYAHDFHPVHHAHLSQMGKAAAAHADEGKPDAGQPGSLEAPHVHGAGRPRRRLGAGFPEAVPGRDFQGLPGENVSGGEPQGFEKLSA